MGKKNSQAQESFLLVFFFHGVPSEAHHTHTQRLGLFSQWLLHKCSYGGSRSRRLASGDSVSLLKKIAVVC